MRNKRLKRIKLNKPILKKFSTFPVIVIENSYITIKWDIKYAFFVRINNGIGFKKPKGEYFQLVQKKPIYKIKAVGLWGIKTFKLELQIQSLNKREIKADRYNNEIKELKREESLSIIEKSIPKIQNIQNIHITTSELDFFIDEKDVINEITEINNTDTINQIQKLKTKYYV